MVSKRDAVRLSTETLFKPVNGRTATTRTRFDKGKYANNLIGRECPDIAGVIAVFSERRKDKDGPYWALYCYSV